MKKTYCQASQLNQRRIIKKPIIDLNSTRGNLRRYSEDYNLHTVIGDLKRTVKDVHLMKANELLYYYVQKLEAGLSRDAGYVQMTHSYAQGLGCLKTARNRLQRLREAGILKIRRGTMHYQGREISCIEIKFGESLIYFKQKEVVIVEKCGPGYQPARKIAFSEDKKRLNETVSLGEILNALSFKT